MLETLVILTLAASVAALAVAGLVWLKVKPAEAVDLAPLMGKLDALERNLERLERGAGEQASAQRRESAEAAKALREEVNQAIAKLGEASLRGMGEVSNVQKNQLESFAHRLGQLSGTIEQKLTEMREGIGKSGESLRTTVEQKLTNLQQDNTAKLEQMRQTVDEKLQGALEKRLGESFKLVSERLEQVHKGLGEMQTLAGGVGDLKRLLTNVKTRGTWGEWQLGSLLEQMLTPQQYEANVAVDPQRNERVEFAIKLPGRAMANTQRNSGNTSGDGASGGEQTVWLPLDAKFPQEDYQRLIDAIEQADAAAAEEARRQLENRVKAMAKDIRDKYIAPPHTTDFAIMYLPTEGLFAEVSGRIGLVETLQRDYRVTVAGPTTLAAFLNSLQMGFRTLAIERRSAEVWELLGAVKGEFGKFGEVLANVKTKLEQAANTIDKAEQRTRVIQRKLKNVEALPLAEGGTAPDALSLTEADDAPALPD